MYWNYENDGDVYKKIIWTDNQDNRVVLDFKRVAKWRLIQQKQHKLLWKRT